MGYLPCPFPYVIALQEVQSKVATLVQCNSGIRVLSFKGDERGHILCVQIQLAEDRKEYIVCNIYAPNGDDPAFFEDVIKMVEEFKDHDGVILGRDFNLIMEPEKDRLNSLNNHHRALGVLKEYMESSNLVDWPRTFIL